MSFARSWRLGMWIAALAVPTVMLAHAIRSRDARAPNIVVVVVDSLRSDRLGAYGSKRGLTPFLDQFAGTSLVYERAYAPSSWTVPSVASLFLGRYPSEHQVARFYAAIPESDTTLAEVLAAHGYVTSGFTANAAIGAAGGFDQGFQRYEVVGEPGMGVPKSEGRFVNDAVLRRIDEMGSKRPQFVYLHYMDAHAPYLAHEWTAPRVRGLRRSDDELTLAVTAGALEANEALRRTQWTFNQPEIDRLEQLYDGEVRGADALLSDLFAALNERHFLDHAIVIITADHGEEFGKRGVFNHGVSLYEAVIRVPLLVRLPAGTPARIAASVEVGGLAARLFAELGIQLPASFTIPPLPVAPTGAPGLAHSELLETKQYAVWLHRYAVMSGNSKLLVASGGDASEYRLDNSLLSRGRSATVSPVLFAALDEFRSGLTRGAPAAPAVLDEATKERLRGLGYAPRAH